MAPEPGPLPPPTRRPTIVAHRANSTGNSPNPNGPAENTIAAIEAAAKAGADAVELDVRQTSDGLIVLAHDPVQWQRWPGGPLPVRWSRRRWLPALADLDAGLDAAFGAGLDVKLDVKAAATAPAVRRHCRDRKVDPARVAFWCRSPAEVAEPGNHDVFGEVALLADGQSARGYLSDATRSRATAISLNPDLLGAASVSAAHEQGLTVYAWIVEPGRADDALGLGVDGVVTDWVAEARQAMP